ncbi:hypothetical protein MtrunA17_Chr4g0076201 [Medicago truncatula]|uniref:Uncharacterized protein n=1 Tax=Medicago truncatula TaxID=3880 RepID=A0A396IL89_MEDTR|nr:hypothetical protein MtrunA17_Chr4g0076201 [Medicago truncatula]
MWGLDCHLSEFYVGVKGVLPHGVVHVSPLFPKICGSALSSVKQVNIGARAIYDWVKPPMVLLSWLLDLASVRSLKVSLTTLQILSLVPNLLELKLPSLCNLKSTEIELEPPKDDMELPHLMKEAMLKKDAAESCEEATKLQKAFEAGLKPPSIPGIVDFLLQNSPSAKVDITTNFKPVNKAINISQFFFVFFS